MSDLRAQIDVAAVVFAETKATFTALQFSEFLRMAGVSVGEEEAGEMLLEIVARKALREIGPGVYARLPNNPQGEGSPRPDGRGSPGGARIGGQP